MYPWRGLQAVFNGTKQNVEAPSAVSVLFGGRWRPGTGWGRSRMLGRGDNGRTKRGIKEGMDKSLGGGSKGLWLLRAPGTAYRKGRVMAGSLSLVWGE